MNDIKLENLSILIVDDEELLREVLVDFLSSKGVAVMEAESGNKAFELVKENKFDLVITDVNMPDGNGFDLLEKISGMDEPRPKVIMATGFAEATLDEVLEKGGVDLFEKPINNKILLATIINSLS